MKKSKNALSFLVLGLSFLLLFGACLKDTDEVVLAETGLFDLTFDHDGKSRKYLLYIPEGLTINAPLVFALHGHTSTARRMMELTQMNEVADAHGFAVCYPQGSLSYSATWHWNARLNISRTDDIGFLSRLAEHLQSEYFFNPQKTFSCGFSNGGFMSYTLACEAPETFKAIASVSGTMSGYTWENRTATPIPVLQIHGERDLIVPINGSMTTVGGWGGAPHLDTVLEYWSDINNCSTTDILSLSSNTTAIYNRDGVNGNEIWYYKIAGFGHSWPGGNDPAGLDFLDNSGIDASEEIWSFFSRY